MNAKAREPGTPAAGGEVTTDWIPYCGAGATPVDLAERWNLDPVLLLVMGAAFGVLWLRTRGRRPWLIAAFAILAISFVSPLCALSSALFGARTVHHLLLVAGEAPLLAMALRPPVKGLAAATAIQTMIFWCWHSPSAYGAALSSDAGYWVMQLSLLGTATWFWSAVRTATAPGAVAGLLVTTVQMGLLGALIAFAGQPLYAPHLMTTAAWGLTPLEDQQIAGLLMWAPALGLYLTAALWRVGRLIGPDTRGAATS